MIDGVLQKFGSAAITHASGRASTAGLDLGQRQSFTQSIAEAVGFVQALSQGVRQAPTFGFACFDCLQNFVAGLCLYFSLDPHLELCHKSCSWVCVWLGVAVWCVGKVLAARYSIRSGQLAQPGFGLFQVCGNFF